MSHLDESVLGLLLLLSIATSFPEIAVSVSSVAYIDSFALGCESLMRSFMINSILLLGIDCYSGPCRRTSWGSCSNLITVKALFLTSLIIVVAASFRVRFDLLQIAPIGVEGFVVIGLYFICLRKTWKNAFIKVLGTINSQGRFPMMKWLLFLCLLLALGFLGRWMAFIGDNISLATNFSRSFVGATLRVLVTSFPEIAFTSAAVRSGSVGMAVGNVLGSNLFDSAVVPFLDFFTKRTILTSLHPRQISVAGIALIISTLLFSATRKKSSKSPIVRNEVFLNFRCWNN